MQKEVRVGSIIFGRRPFVFIGGPCVIEGREATLRIAERLWKITSELQIPFVFKSSYDKANRTSVSSFRGPGLEEGLRILGEVKEQVEVPVLTDVHSPDEARAAAEVVDILQVPALLSRQTDLLVACGETRRAVNIKKGQFLSPAEVRYAVEKVESTGNERILVTERGTFFGYNTLVNDFRALPVMRELGYPVVFDATHSVQMPGAAHGASGGERQFIFPLARAAVAVGCDAIFMEAHEEPDRARCDGANSVQLDGLAAMLATLRRIEDAL
ncbi:MAG TPA: 3-deoxy-8-phosphooctulonate synthase [Syntrophorhabdales bacterium]|nr:3-deoxy-8-phosphooctulonate synthase [Syntrophorhabdales bacterium]